MYLKKLKFNGLKCFESLEVDFPHTGDDYSGWIVLLGGNGTGKSTLLQAMALAMLGPVASQQLLRPRGWVRQGAAYATIEAELVRGAEDSAEGKPRQKPYQPRLAITGEDEVSIDDQLFNAPQLVLLNQGQERNGLLRGPYDARKPGWFSCGYGPFRRLSGGAEESELVYSAGREGRMASLFRESVALTRCERWLTSLYSRSQDPNLPDRERYAKDFNLVREIIDELLPQQVKIDKVNSEGAFFRVPGGASVAVPDLSDGYRSFLALAIDVLRHLQESDQGLERLLGSSKGRKQLLVEGVVLIDEADAHLHPLWQRQLGSRLRQVFPKLQFIVTSHSPFIAQAASENGLFVLRQQEANGPVQISQPEPSVKGWRVEQILLSPLFGLTETRDEETVRLLNEHRTLTSKKEWGALSPEEKARLVELEEQLSHRLTAPGDTLEERQRQEAMGRYIDATLKQLGEMP